MTPLRWSTWLGAALVLALAACNSPQRVEPFTDYVPAQQLSVSTDVIDPVDPALKLPIVGRLGPNRG